LAAGNAATASISNSIPSSARRGTGTIAPAHADAHGDCREGTF
jgi:hypothetical protein